MRIAFTGTQRGLTLKQYGAVNALLLRLNPSVLVHGACVGADDAADKLAVIRHVLRIIWPSTITSKSIPSEALKMRGGQCIIMPAAPPLDRNIKIIESADMLIVCPGEDHEVRRSGTWSTYRAAKKLPGYRRGTYKIEVIYP